GGPAYKRLQSRQYMGGNDHRVDILLRLRAMAALAFYSYVQLIGRGHILASTKTHLACIDQRHYVLTQYGLRFWIFEHALFDHQAGAAGQPFLRRLKD